MSKVIVVGIHSGRVTVAPTLGEASLDSYQGRWRQPKTSLRAGRLRLHEYGVFSRVLSVDDDKGLTGSEKDGVYSSGWYR